MSTSHSHIDMSADALEAIAVTEVARLTNLTMAKKKPLSDEDVRRLGELQKIVERAKSARRKITSGKAGKAVDSAREGVDLERTPVHVAAKLFGQTPRSLQLWRKKGAPWGDDEGVVKLGPLIQWRLNRMDSREEDGGGEKPKTFWEKNNLREQAAMRRIRRLEAQHVLISAPRYTEEVSAAFTETSLAIQRLGTTLPGALADLAIGLIEKLIPAERLDELRDELCVINRGRLAAEFARELESLSRAIEQCQPPQVQSQERSGHAARSDGSTSSTIAPVRGSASRSRRASGRARSARAARPGRKHTSR